MVMKKFLLLLLVVASVASYGQKKKPAKGKAVAKTTAAKKSVLAKADNLSAELLEKKDSYRFYAMSGTDTLSSKSIPKKNGAPADCKITPFGAKGAKLYAISWVEKYSTGDAKTKLENTTETHTEIWDEGTKTKLYDNTQKVINISEIVWLDANKTASKTVEKIRRDGFELTVTPEGDLLLKNKTQQDRLTYDAAQKKFVAKK